MYDILNRFKVILPQLPAVISGSLIGINAGMQFGWTAPVIPRLLAPDSPIKTSKQQAEHLETFLMMGSFVTLCFTPYLVDKIGRKSTLLMACVLASCGWTLIAAAPSIEYILVARIFGGASSSFCFVAAPIYIAEVAHETMRGFLSSILFFMILIGNNIIYMIGPFIPIYAQSILVITILSLQLVIFPFMPESPYYYFYKNKPEEARNSLERLRRSGGSIEKELQDIRYATERQKTEKGDLTGMLLVPSNRKAVIIMILLNIAQNLGGISTMNMNIHSILNAAGSIYMESSTVAIMYSMLMLSSTIVSASIIDKFGRKSLLIISSILCGLCHVALATFFALKNSSYNVDTISWIPIASVIFYACFFKLGLGIVPLILTSELFSAKIKGIGMTLADGLFALSSIISIHMYQKLTNNYGMQYPFYMFTLFCAIVATFTYFMIPETKGRTLEEIQLILKGQDPKVQNNTDS